MQASGSESKARTAPQLGARWQGWGRGLGPLPKSLSAQRPPLEKEGGSFYALGSVRSDETTCTEFTEDDATK